MPYQGRQPGVGVRSRFIYTAAGGQTTFSGADDNGKTLAYQDGAYVDVFLNGVCLVPSTDFTATTKTSVTLASGATASDIVEIVAYDIASMADTVSKANGGTFDGAITINGDLKPYGGVSGTGNVSVGETALAANTGNNNTAVGYQSLYTNTAGTNMAAFGYQALYFSNTTGSVNNNAFGFGSQYSTSTGTANTSVGHISMYSNTTGSSNVCIGQQALYSNTTASDNTAVGYQAGYSNTTGGENTFIGRWAGYSSNASSANAGNICVGARSGYYLTTGIANTFVGSNNPTGYGAGFFVTTGSKNTILGCYSGNQGGLDIRTSSNNIVLADGDGNPRIYNNASNQTLLGTVSTTTPEPAARLHVYNNGASAISAVGADGAWGVKIGVISATGTRYMIGFCDTTSATVGGITHNGSSVSYNTTSDYRLKENVVELTGATDRIKQIPVHRFNFIADADTTVDGFLAHEVQAIVPEAVTGEKDAVDADGNPVYQGIDQSKLVPLLVATIKELEARIAALEAK